MLWALLCLTIAGYMFLAFLQKPADPPESGSSASSLQDLQMRMSCRYALGVNQYAALLAQGGSSIEALIDQLDSLAGSRLQRLRLLPVVAELQGEEEALRRIDSLLDSWSGDGAEQGLESDLRALRTIYLEGPDSLDEAARQGLLQRHGWYAELSLTHGLDASSQERQRVMRPVLRTFFSLLAAGLAVLGAGGAGLMLLIAAFAFRRAGKLPTAFQPFASGWPPQGPVLLEVVLLFLLALPLVQLLSFALSRLTGFETYWLTAWLILLIPLWPLRRGLPAEDLKKALGWRPGRGFWREAGAGLTGYLAGLPIIFTGLLLSFLIIRLSHTQPTHPLAVELTSAGWWRILQIYLLACVWAPLLEELVFRGALFSHLRRRLSPWLAGLSCGLVFALVHPQGLAALPVLASVGFVLCMIREWRGSLIACSTAHALHNFAALTVTLLLLGI
ncbi:MAG: CPBP family intramembrane glutamic endopeptidase [Acidobacteriota bacterium]